MAPSEQTRVTRVPRIVSSRGVRGPCLWTRTVLFSKNEYWRSIVDRRAPGRVAACCEPSARAPNSALSPSSGSAPRPSPARPTIDSASGGGVELVEAGPRAARPSVAEAVYAGARAHARPAPAPPRGTRRRGRGSRRKDRLGLRLAAWPPGRFPYASPPGRATRARAPSWPREEPHTPQATTKHIAEKSQLPE